MLCSHGGLCPFCNARRENGFDIVMENDRFIVFENYKPMSSTHLLVIPREHIESVKSLNREDVGLVAAMRDSGNEALTLLKVPIDQRLFGFHIPPLTSVAHLHLHCFGLPFNNALGQLKYPVAERRNGTKGWSWFAEVSQVIRTLERGGRVGVLPEKLRSASTAYRE